MKRTYLGILAALLALVLPAATLAVCTNTVIQPGSSGKDAYVISYYPNSNNGNEQELRAKYGTIGSPDIFEESYLQFDLSGIPSNSTNISSTLTVTKYYSGGSGVRNVSVRSVNASWNESSITWNNKAAVYPEILDTKPVNIGTFGTVDFGVTTRVTSWIKGTWPNDGFHLSSNTPVDRFAYSTRFYSSDYNGTNASTSWPKLSVFWCN